jgi:L-ascorbate metabolism protein UlaG (beta-lactamase superfamily)
MLPKIYGTQPSGPRLQRILNSPQYKEGAFQNQEPTAMGIEGASFLKVMGEMRKKTKLARPPVPLPATHTDITSMKPGPVPQMVWFGHSSYYILSDKASLLVDPVFSPNASPLSFFGKAFEGTSIYSADDFGPIDVLLLTHDHYDHLDYKTVVALAPKVGAIVTSLGVGAHLEYWGIPAHKIHELDWGERWGMFTALPGRHFSGRTFKRNQTLWSSFVLQLGEYRILLGGDSGYGPHFASIGAQYGPFDLAILENGQYGVYWPHIHMFPEQTWQAARDLGTKALWPVHWGKFDLSLHAWDEPIRRLVQAVKNNPAPIDLITPRIGQPFSLQGPYPTEHWWEDIG